MAFSLVPFILVFIFYVVYTWHLRSGLPYPYPGLAVDLNFPVMLNVLEIQLFATLPFSNLYGQGQVPQLLALQLSDLLNLISVIILGVLAGALVILLMVRAAIQAAKLPIVLIFFGLTLWIVPACILMPSTKYQNELRWGIGYLPLLIQNFGLALLMAYVVQIILDAKGPLAKSAFVLLSLVGVIAIFSAFLFNSVLVKVRNYNTCLPADAQYRSVKSGILSPCAPGSDIILSDDYFWHNHDLYEDVLFDTYNRWFNVYYQGDWKHTGMDANNQGKVCYLLDCPSGDTVYVRLYKLDCATGNKIELLRSDTTMHNIRVAELERHILELRK
jgi:hypothetical protein